LWLQEVFNGDFLSTAVHNKAVKHEWTIFWSGLNFINVLCTAFTLADLESVKRCWWLDCIFYAFMYSFYTRRSRKHKKMLMTWLYFFMLSASTSVKALCKTLVKVNSVALAFLIIEWEKSSKISKPDNHISDKLIERIDGQTY